MAISSGKVLIAHDRGFGARFIAGVDEVGRGSLAGPLVAAGVVLDLERLRGRQEAALSGLRDSKRCSPETRERLLTAILAASALVVVEVVSSCDVDRSGVHKANLEALRRAVSACVPPAEVCLVDGFALGPEAPVHEALVGGDGRSAAIACASIVAKVVRDRTMRRFDSLYPQFGFAANVGYITGAHAAAVREHGRCCLHRRSFRAACFQKS